MGDIEQAIEKNLPFLDMVSPDADVCIAPVEDSLDADEWCFHVSDIDADFLTAQWETVKNHSYHPNVSIEFFAYEVQENEKEFYNSSRVHKRHATSQSSY